MSVASLASVYGRGRPDVDEAWVAAVVAERFGLAATASELGSQQDRNFRVDAAGSAYVLKVFHAATPSAVVDDQLAAMRRLSAAGIPAPQPVGGQNGSVRQTVTAADGETHIAVLLTYLEGTQLVDLPRISRRLARELARLAGRACRALADADRPHPRTSQWDLRVPLDVVRELAAAVPPSRRSELLETSQAAWSEVERYAEQLPLQVIHGDITDDNVVATIAADGTVEPVGVIDFGDLVYSWRIGELVVLLASMLHHEVDDLSVLVDMVDVFDTEVGLSDIERRVIWPLVQLRCAVLVVSGWQQLRVDPDNEYASDRMAHEAACFERAASVPTAVMANLLLPERSAAAAGIGRQLRVRSTEAPVVVSLAAESGLLADGSWTGPDAEEALLAAVVADRGLVALPHGEFRLTRSGPDAASVGPCNFALASEIVAALPFLIEAADHLTVEAVSADGVVARTADGRSLRVRGLVASVAAGDRLEPGSALGLASAVGAFGLCRVHVQVSADDLPLFCTADSALGYAPLVAGSSAVIGLAEPELIDPAVQDAAEQARRDRFLPPNTERYYATPPTMVRGWGAYLIDSRSRVYLDLVNNVAAIGHSHPTLRRAVNAELESLNTNSRFLYRRLADYSERLLATTGDSGYDSVLLVNSGTEAIDLALRIAKLATGRNQVITHREGYHGWSLAADAITTSAFDNPNALANRPSWVTIANTPNPYRGRYRGADAASGYLADFAVLLSELEAAGTPAAAVVMESILGNSGGVIPPAGYFAGIIEQLHAHGGVSIADEVQVGFGRTGASFWAAQAEGARPDIIVSAKAMGNGFPLGAVITSKELSSVLGKEGPFFSTTGGSPAACAAGLAVLDVIEGEGLMQSARTVGDYLTTQLLALAQRHPLIGAVHGRGLYQGIELITDPETLAPASADAALLCEALLTRGVVDQVTSERQNVLKVKPPMTFSRADADLYTEALDDLLTRGWK